MCLPFRKERPEAQKGQVTYPKPSSIAVAGHLSLTLSCFEGTAGWELLRYRRGKQKGGVGHNNPGRLPRRALKDEKDLD